MSLLSSGSLSTDVALVVRIGAMATVWSLKIPDFSIACSADSSAKRLGIGRILDHVAAVGEHRRLVDAAEAACRVHRAGKEREVLRQVRQVHVGELALRLVAVPLERARDDVDVLIRLVAHQAVAFEQALHQPLDDLRLLLREAAMDDQHVGDDQQVAVGGEDVGLSAAAAHHLGDLRLPGHAAGELVLARLHVAQEQVAGLEAVLGVDHVQPIGVRRRVEAAERIDRPARLPARGSG